MVPARIATTFARPEPAWPIPAPTISGSPPQSPLIDAGQDPGAARSFALWPQFEYVHPASGRARQRVGALDAGAYEFCGW